jgi:hypothetical protein
VPWLQSPLRHVMHVRQSSSPRATARKRFAHVRCCHAARQRLWQTCTGLRREPHRLGLDLLDRGLAEHVLHAHREEDRVRALRAWHGLPIPPPYGCSGRARIQRVVCERALVEEVAVGVAAVAVVVVAPEAAPVEARPPAVHRVMGARHLGRRCRWLCRTWCSWLQVRVATAVVLTSSGLDQQACWSAVLTRCLRVLGER